MAKPRVIIVGAGFGGLECARRLAGKPVDVLVVDKNNYHLFTPLLYQVASSLLNPSDIAYPIRAVFRKAKNVHFRLAEVTSLDFVKKMVRTHDGEEISYDFLVLAAGSTTNYFGISDVQDRSLGLKDLPQALALRNHVLGCFEAACRERDPGELPKWLTFVVVGGGPTGIEYAGALCELVRLVLGQEYPELDLKLVRIVLVEAMERLLANFSAGLSRNAQEELEKRGVEVHLGARVTGRSHGGVRLSSGETLEGKTMVWTAGVKPVGLASSLGVALSRSGRIQLDPFLRIEGQAGAFAIGDIASFVQDGTELPMYAPPARQQAWQAAKNIVRLAQGQKPQPFRYRDKGMMATIGRHAAVCQIGGLVLRGFSGWIAWLALHLYYLIGFRNRLAVLLEWMWDYFRYDRPVRLIVRAEQPSELNRER